MNDAWLAGFFDGEGCITTQSVKIKGKYDNFPRVNMQIIITQKDRTVLDEIQKEFGGKVYSKGDGSKCSNLKIVGKQKMKTFLLSIYPYSKCKKEQIELALKFIETIREENLGCVAMPRVVHDLRDNIHWELRRLKNAGN